MKGDRNLWVLVFVCVINSMGFGIIVPLLYSYGKKFGLNEQTVGILTASFSVAQFFATPLLGALSDKWGRKPVLAISLAGTCASFLLFASAQSLIFLFAARILDGITGGNISVAQAMISDCSTAEDRAKKFGILSSAFGFGFVIGPALGGLLSKLDLQAPFYFAAGIALIGVLCTVLFLKETLPSKAVNQKNNNTDCRQNNTTETKDNKFTFASLLTAIKLPVIGTAVFIGFLLTMAQFTMIIGFQTFSVDVLKLTTTQIGLYYAGFGITGILMQLAVPIINKYISSKALILLWSTLVCLVVMCLAGASKVIVPFIAAIYAYGLFNGLRNPMLNAIIANHNDENRQGEILGVNQSYASLGQVLGPVAAGLITVVSIHAVFYLSAVFILIGFLFTFRLKSKEKANT